MPNTHYRGRRAVSLESSDCRVSVTLEGGHIAEFTDKPTAVNPLWSPPWPTIEPSTYDPARHPEYGRDAESKLLAGILGHNLCLDLFGGPSDAEAAAGITVHGEGSVRLYDVQETPGGVCMAVELPLAQLRFERRLHLSGRVLRIEETVQNVGATDRPIAWTQHVTMGPPFITPGQTKFQIPGVRSRTIEHDFAAGKGYMPVGIDFQWPEVPTIDGGTADMRTYTSRAVSAAFSTHLMDPGVPQAFFLAFSPTHRLQFGYIWNQADFPWLGIWEENCSRDATPWNGQAITCGMEFGASPMPESRRQMIDRGKLFGVPAFRWIEAGRKISARYCAFLMPAEAIASEARWDGHRVSLR